MHLAENGHLTVGADLTYPPFGFHPPGKVPVGLEIDLVRALAHDLKLELVVANRGTGALITGAIAHRHDLAASGLRDSDDLRSVACVSAPYMTADLAILTANPDPHKVRGPKDLDDRLVGVLENSRAERWAKETLDGSTLASLPATDDLLEALRQRKVDAVVDELAIARFAAKESSEFSVAANIETGESYVLATAKDNGGLIAKVNAALARFKARGGLTKLEKKWFGG